MSHGHSIRCHSPLKHYEMFHSSSMLGGFNNSIFGGIRMSTTYNFNYNDGGFWGGFKNGIGLGLGNLFGGLFGGFMGGIFGGFGNMFGGFGGGMGFGFPWGGGFGGGYGNYGGGAGNYGDNAGADRSGRRTRTNSDRLTNNSSTTGTTGTQSADKCKDADRKNIKDLHGEFNAVGENPAKAEALRNKINEAIKNQKDNHQDDYDDDDYKFILARLNEKFTFDDSGKATLKNPANAGAGAGAGLGDGALNGDGLVDTVKNLDNTLSTMSDADKDFNFIKTIPDSVKSQYYKLGYTNYDGSEDITDKDVSNAHDESDVGLKDTVRVDGKENATIIKSSGGNHPETIVIHDRKDITYTFKGKAGSEYIYESDQDKQLYVLQKDSNGEFHLMQYKYMKGNAKKDWS